MKPGLALLTALFGLGVWLYVQLAPYPSERRWDEFKRLPGVEDVVEWNDMRAIKAQFSEAGGQGIRFNRKGETSNWASFEEWKVDFDAYDRNARYWYNAVQNADLLEEARKDLEPEAEGGSLEALRMLALMGVGQTRNGQSIAAMLRKNGSATAQMTLQQFVTKEMDPRSREGMLLSARAMQENYRWESLTDAQFAESTESNRRGLATLQQQAEAGDEDAKWVWGRLHGDTAVRIRVPN